MLGYGRANMFLELRFAVVNLKTLPTSNTEFMALLVCLTSIECTHTHTFRERKRERELSFCTFSTTVHSNVTLHECTWQVNKVIDLLSVSTYK